MPRLRVLFLLITINTFLSHSFADTNTYTRYNKKERSYSYTTNVSVMLLGAFLCGLGLHVLNNNARQTKPVLTYSDTEPTKLIDTTYPNDKDLFVNFVEKDPVPTQTPRKTWNQSIKEFYKNNLESLLCVSHLVHIADGLLSIILKLLIILKEVK